MNILLIKLIKAINDIETASKIFSKIGYIPNLFSYPFGEYSEFMRQYISKILLMRFIMVISIKKISTTKFPINNIIEE